MMHFGLLIELIAIIALIVGVPIPIAGTVALIAATPTSAVYRCRGKEILGASDDSSAWVVTFCGRLLGHDRVFQQQERLATI